MGRIETLCSYLGVCDTFADVGCDHGYCTLYMLKNALCAKAYITDISQKCLAKAEKLLQSFIAAGKCESVCCDGLKGLPEDIDEVLIAGMGGEEIIKILKEGFIPRKFVLQPMKNAPSLRRFLLDSGCAITADDIFGDGKFYFVIKGERGGGTVYGERELALGRDSLKNPLLKEYLRAEIAKKESYIQNCSSENDIRKLAGEAEFMRSILNEG